MNARPLGLLLLGTAWLALAACGSGGDGDSGPTPPPTSTPTPPAASVAVPVDVPPLLAAAPFDVARQVTVPPGFGLRVVARIDGARFMAEAPNGDLLVSQPDSGRIWRVTPDGATNVYATGLHRGHDLVFHEVGNTQYLYIGETDRISRTEYVDGDATSRARGAVITNLPDASLPELNGAYGHALKNIAFAGSTLFVSIASASNADPADILATPKRGAIYAFDENGGGMRLYAQGLRNAEGLAIHPVTGELWAAVNHRDNVRYPLKDGRFPYKALDPAYYNDNPPEPFTRVRDGGNYGWPYCNPTADAGPDNLPYYLDVENNEDQQVLDCGGLDRVSKALPAHSAPLGMSFWTGGNVPDTWRNGAVIGLHGCWNCTVPRGYKVVYLPPRADNGFGDPQDLVTGFLADPADIASRWGRPVDVIPNRAGNLYISDDHAGAVYELYRK
ncbi:PQQ-dependent sugar dehydrogenase [Chitiniphilus shinanonensis]|uniref:PQQ-dependent sugar dehydrogenase n=1 Tax=Chitiniphilus shinanonensis TaxID=553088 RepID=UPI00302C1BD0